MHAAPARRRAGFTLIELLVAIGLAIVITATTVAVLNTGVIESQRVISSADKVSQWLITAKNRAKRDGRPRGVRFFRSVTDTNLLTEAQYIESPPPYNPNPTATPGGGRIVFVYALDWDPMSPTYGMVKNRYAYFVSDTASDLTTFDQQVKVGDLLYVPEFGTSYKLLTAPLPLPANATAATPFPKAKVQTIPRPPAQSTDNARLLTLTSYPDLGAANSPPGSPPATNPLMNPPDGCYTTYGFSVQQSPRPLFGEPVLQLSPDAVIDARTASPATTLPATLAGGNVPPSTDIQILFAPSGQVMNATDGVIALLVRDPNKPEGNPLSLHPLNNFDNAGQMAIVAVSTKTGAVATHAVLPGTDPFRAAKDGINAGF